MTAEPREFDLIVYGATGYTGRLVAEYLAQQQAAAAAGGDPIDPWPWRWAMAGRSMDKLAEVRDLIGAPADTPLIVADASDPASLDALCARTKVVVTTVGPYQLYGNELVAACVRAGIGYADLCGEPAWMRQMIEAHHGAAKQSGAHITFSCGFDSIPFDLGVFVLQQECIHRFGAPAPRIKGRVRAMNGKFSGGTAASLKATMAAAAKDRSVIATLASPFGLTPGFEGPAQPAGNQPEYDESLGSWATSFIMAPINTKNVHRTNFLLGHLYGADFVYDEMLLTGPGEGGEQMAKFVATTPMIGTENDPKPGEGPTKEERDSGYYDVLFVATYPDGRSLRLAVKGDKDPGYGSTSKMLAETGIALATCTGPGGVWTPGALLGMKLVERLEANAGLTFTIEE